MIKENVLSALNDQLNHEFHSAYHYLAMESFFRSLNLRGFARWAHDQYQEERTHALRFYDYIHDRDRKVRLNLIAEPPNEWTSVLLAVQEAYDEEQRASESINDLVDLAHAERDHATDIFLKWFVERQVEEEAHVGSIVQKLKLIGEDKYGLFLIDRDMA
jgi:ferritin